MTTEPTVPEAMLEAAAKALHGYDDCEPTWDNLDDPAERQVYRGAAAAALAAALSVCEVRTEDQVRGYHTEGEEWIHGYPRDPERTPERLADMRRDGYINVGLRRRLEIFTPWEPVEDVPGGER